MGSGRRLIRHDHFSAEGGGGNGGGEGDEREAAEVSFLYCLHFGTKKIGIDRVKLGVPPNEAGTRKSVHEKGDAAPRWATSGSADEDAGRLEERWNGDRYGSRLGFERPKTWAGW